MSITLNDVTNTSIDNTTKSIAGLTDNTEYYLSARLTHTSSGKVVTIPRLSDSDGNLVRFKTKLNQTITLNGSAVTKTQNSISFHLASFFSTRSTNVYDLNVEVFELNDTSGVYTQISLYGYSGITNSNYNNPLKTFDFTGLKKNTSYKIEYTVFNSTLMDYYRDVNGIIIRGMLYPSIRTNDYIINFTIQKTNTTLNYNSATFEFLELYDNTPHNTSSVFSDIVFRLTDLDGSIVDQDETNVAFLYPTDPVSPSRFFTVAGLQAGTTYNLTGRFTRNTLYTNVLDLNYQITTPPYAVIFTMGPIDKSSDSISFRYTSLYDVTSNLSSNTFSYINYRIETIGPNPDGFTYPMLDVPFNSTTTTRIDGLAPNTEYKITATFERTGLYRVDNILILTQKTDPESDDELNDLNATLTVNDDTVTTSQSSVTFQIIDFESTSYVNNEFHTVQINAITEQEYQRLLVTTQNYVLLVSFGLNEVDIWSDALGNNLVGKHWQNPISSAYYLDNTAEHGYYMKTLKKDFDLQIRPLDWRSFDPILTECVITIKATIPDSEHRGKMLFRNVSDQYGQMNGVLIQLYDSYLTFRAHIRYEDGNAKNVLFNHGINTSALTNMYDTPNVFRCEYKLTPTNVNDETVSYCETKIYINNELLETKQHVDTIANVSVKSRTEGFFHEKTEDSHYTFLTGDVGSELYYIYLQSSRPDEIPAETM